MTQWDDDDVNDANADNANEDASEVMIPMYRPCAVGVTKRHNALAVCPAHCGLPDGISFASVFSFIYC